MFGFLMNKLVLLLKMINCATPVLVCGFWPQIGDYWPRVRLSQSIKGLEYCIRDKFKFSKKKSTRKHFYGDFKVQSWDCLTSKIWS